MTTYREIPGFPGYMAGDDGEIWSFKAATKTWKKLKPTRSRKGYLNVELWKGRRPFRFLVHRLVLETFVGPCPKGQIARHFPDRSPGNCRLENLQWGTRAENEEDKKIHGTAADRNGEKHPLAKLSLKDVAEIRQRHSNGETQKALAKEYRVKRSCISKIATGRRWKNT